MDKASSTSVINPKSLGLSLLLLLASILATAAMVFAVLQMQQKSAQTHKQVLAQQNETRARLARASEDETEIRDKISRYQDLIASGRTQPERRLDWVETLKQIKESRRLLDLDYEISPQRPLSDKAPSTGGYDFLASPMKLNMPLLHENDLLGLLSDLSLQVQALISARQCTIERTAPAGGARNASTLKATCEIDWITLREKS
jgi:hypothetical protein